MPRMIEIKTGNNLTIAGPARVIVYGAPTLTPPTTLEVQSNDHATQQSKPSRNHKAA